MKVAFICTANAARSQMAEGLLRSLARGDWEVYSAGSYPAWGVHPDAVKAMDEIGIDISGQRSKGIPQLPKDLDVVITVCDSAAKECPVFPGNVRRYHWSVTDPAGSGLVAFRAARDDLKSRIVDFLSSEGKKA